MKVVLVLPVMDRRQLEEANFEERLGRRRFVAGSQYNRPRFVEKRCFPPATSKSVAIGLGMPVWSRVLWRRSQNHIKPARQFANSRAFQRPEIDHQAFKLLFVFDALQNHVASVARVAFDIALGCQKVFTALTDLIVNMWSSAWVWNRFDRPESVFAGGSRQKSAISLKVSIAFIAIITA